MPYLKYARCEFCKDAATEKRMCIHAGRDIGRIKMRKAQKQDVLGCVESLHKAHKEIKDALSERNYNLVQNMLSQCQEFAVSLGENIERLEGEGHTAVVCLEDYCETLYSIYREINSGDTSSSKAYKKLQKQLIKVDNSARNDIKVRKEIVFLPYKASMWDSLESVWKAADQDPDCDAYVIPIPYYDKKPDGSFGEMHYEADLYPAYVPVVHYAEYDFDKRRPDVIFIHNPYDECNLVTSVVPFFYTKNLKRYTEMLVYIPYFILWEIDPENKAEVESIAHFVTVPGVVNADRVIVQSEAIRQAYIHVMTNLTGEHTKNSWEEKILGLGSPKIDKVLNTKQEELEIPEEWKRILYRLDGSRKKVILYNTSVSALLENSEKMLGKIQDVFGIFQENKDKVALLWRPHPLIQATISSMRPQLWREYERVVEEYREAGWGIYDDTAELDRALVLCDGYYGDRSSLEALCQKMGKPIMIQNVQFRLGEKGI